MDNNLDEFNTLFRQGAEYLEQGKYKYALAYAHLHKLVELYPKDSEAWNIHGIALGMLEKYEDAITSFDQAIKLKPDNNIAQNNRSKAQKYREVIAFDDKLDSAVIYLYMGVESLKLEKYEKAVTHFDKALQLNLNDDIAWLYLGFALGILEKYQEAVICFDQVLRLKQDDAIAVYYRGLALQYLGRYEEAIDSYDRALEIQPDFDQVWDSRGAALQYLGRYEEAIVSHDKAVELKPDRYQAWYNRGLAAGKSQDLPDLNTQQLNPELNKRGYEGELASYYTGLNTSIDQETNREGWEYLHYEIARSHYFHSRHQLNDFTFIQKAEEVLKKAFPIPKPKEFHLKVLQDLIQYLVALNKLQELRELQRLGTDILRRVLADPQQTALSKQEIKTRFANFNQSTVDLVVESENLIEALTLAEAGKNVCLRWLLGTEEIPEIEYSQIQTLLNATTAAVYWHLSPAALTTFIIKSNRPAPILISHPRINHEQSEASQRLIELEDWMEDWDKQYSDYRQKAKDKRSKNHPWRYEMQQRLFERQAKPGNLRDILNIAEIERHLTGIENLILMPHRDLHRFPIHALFSSLFTITYLPSFQMGIMLQNRQFSPNDSLLSIENPSRDLGFARVEAEGIAQYFEQVKTIQETRGMKTKIKNYIDKDYSVFHFAGHAEHIPENPQQSRLHLSTYNKDTEPYLTLADLSHNAFSGYSLVTLSACETAITNNQTITSEYVGLVSGFLRSGAAQVVSTLWTVESGASALVMIEFYRQRSLGKSNSKALAAAVHWLRNLTAKDLQQWREDFLSKSPLESSRRKTSIKQSLRSENWDIIDPESKVYDSPYFWAAFIISGQVT